MRFGRQKVSSSVTMLGRTVWFNRCCVLISQLTLVMLGGSQAVVLHLPPEPHLQLLGRHMNSFSINSASSFYSSPRSLRLEQMGCNTCSSLSCRFQSVLAQLYFTSSVSSQLPSLLPYDDFRPNTNYKSNCFPQIFL